MSNSIENIKKYLTDFKKYNAALITDADIEKFKIIGDLSNANTGTSIMLGNDDTNTLRSFKIQQILHNLNNNTTIGFEDDGIMFFTISGVRYDNIMELFTKDDHSAYANPSQISDTNANTYFDYFMRYKLLKSTITLNTSDTKSIDSTQKDAYKAGTTIKDLYDFIVELKDLDSSELPHTSYIHILKCFKYYYQMALIIMNYAFIYKIKTDLASEAATLHTGVVDVQDNIQNLIRTLVIEYAISAPAAQTDAKKTAIQNLINLGHINKTNYKYTFILNPNEDGVAAYVANSIYFRINSKIDSIDSTFGSIKACFGNEIGTVVDANAEFATIFNCHTSFGRIKQSIDDIKTIEATGLTSQVITDDSDVMKYKTYISALESFFSNIEILTSDTGSSISVKINAINNIANYIKYLDSAETAATIQQTNLLAIKDLRGNYNDEVFIANQIISMNKASLIEAKTIYDSTPDGASSPASTSITLNIDDSTAADSAFATHPGLVYSATADIITESGTVPDKTYYIADNVSTIAIAGVSSPTAAGDDIGSLTGVKYYTRTTGNGSYIFAPGNDIARVEVPSNAGIFYLMIEHTATSGSQEPWLYITLIFRSNSDMLDNKITSFKSANATYFTNIFSTLFNAFSALPGTVITDGKFGYELKQKLIEIRDKYITDTTPENPNETIIYILFTDLSVSGDDSASPQERTRFRSLGKLVDSSGNPLPDDSKLKFSIISSGNDLNTKKNTEYDGTIATFLRTRPETTIKDALDNYFNYHDKKDSIDQYLCSVTGDETDPNSASRRIAQYITDEERPEGDFDITANSNQFYTDSKDSIKDQNNLYKENVDKYKTKNNELNNILKNNLYNNIFLYITIVVLILICFGLIYINNHKASLKTQYSVMLIAFLLLYYIIYTNIVVNVTEPFLSGCSNSSNGNKYSQQIINLHSKITSFLSINIYDKNKSDDINESLNKEKNKYTGFVKSSNSKLNSLELVLNDEFINAIKSKELVKFLILFTAICIISYIVYTNTEDLATTSIIFIILFVIILMIYFYNINLMTRTKADNKYWNHQMVMK